MCRSSPRLNKHPILLPPAGGSFGSVHPQDRTGKRRLGTETYLQPCAPSQGAGREADGGCFVFHIGSTNEAMRTPARGYGGAAGAGTVCKGTDCHVASLLAMTTWGSVVVSVGRPDPWPPVPAVPKAPAPTSQAHFMRQLPARGAISLRCAVRASPLGEVPSAGEAEGCCRQFGGV